MYQLRRNILVLHYKDYYFKKEKANIGVKWYEHLGPRGPAVLSQWLVFVSLAVLYNLVFTIGRAVFWELNRALPTKLWWTFDIASDLIYVLDTVVHAHEGNREESTAVLLMIMLAKHKIICRIFVG